MKQKAKHHSAGHGLVASHVALEKPNPSPAQVVQVVQSGLDFDELEALRQQLDVPLDRLASGSPRRIDSLTGALTGVVRGATLRRQLIQRLGLPSIAAFALGPLGDVTFSAQTSTTGIEASGDLAIH